MALERIPFVLRGVPGTVTVDYGVNDDPQRWGYHLLQLPYDFQVSRGCPVLRATVDHPAEGYGAALGWIQTVETRSPEQQDAFVDLAPQMVGCGSPWLAWAVRPELFDAPSTAHPEFSFQAETFLAYTPDCVITREVKPLCGFSWGYEVRGGEPSVLPLRLGNLDRWASAQPLLSRQCPGWTFLAA